MIKKISELVGDASYIKTPIFKKKHKSKNNNYIDPNFKATVFRAENDEYKQNFSKIQIQINKLSDKNYDIIRNETFEIVDKIKQHMSDNDFEKLGNCIFKIASSNSFYSHLYAKIYSELMSKYEIFETIIEKSFIEYLKIFDEITSQPSADENYEEFCRINIQNDKRRSLSKFITSLLKCDVIQSIFVIEIIENLIINFKTYIETEEMTTSCDEISENLKILIGNSMDILNNLNDNDESDKWLQITEEIKSISKMKTTNYKSFSKKTLFKFYDIVDLLKKK